VRLTWRTGLAAILLLASAFLLRATYAQRGAQAQATACTAQDFHLTWRTGSGSLSSDTAWLELEKTKGPACRLAGSPHLVVGSSDGALSPLLTESSTTLQTWSGGVAPRAPLHEVLGTGAVVGVALLFTAQSTCPYASVIGVQISSAVISAVPLGFHTQCDGNTVSVSGFFLVHQGA
jgi:hypothetical protein